ncbi:MAG: Gldg family protein [Anaerolineales bacterium]
MRQIYSILRKELSGYFGSPMALIFVGFFLAAALFSFFWVDAFFARGIADVRPLFRSMPLLMIILVAALTMRQWSEEQRSGTLEILLTLPVSHIQLVIGKFLAVVTLVVVALVLTLTLPITVALLGDLDWGPVAGGYLAAILLACSYTAIGLFVSSRTDNQIVALMATVLICGVFYLLGSSGITDLLPDASAELVKSIATSSRFESIERGVIDLRDLVYYLSLTGVFLVLNVASLDRIRWSTGSRTLEHRKNANLVTALVVVNLVFVNVWMYPLRGARLDLTEQKEYSLSQATRDLLADLQEPLLIRGYFSEKTHPLLAPLIPQIRDMLREYQIAAGGKLEVDIVDPATDPDIEAEANQTYGIRPTPFQISGRYEASVINSYFNILMRYGDQSVVLNYGDLIEVETLPDNTLDVHLRNLEYDLTRSIKKVVYGFQSVDAVLAAMSEPATLTLYVTPSTVPEDLRDSISTVQTVAGEIEEQSPGKFEYRVVNMDTDTTVTQQDLYDRYGLQPIAVELFSDEVFYYYMVLEVGDEVEIIYPTMDMTEGDIRANIESALKRASPGFLKVVGLWVPPAIPTQDMFGNTQNPISTWNMISTQLRQDYEVQSVDLSSGSVPTDIEVLVLVGPQNLSDVGVFAVDQFLMRGGSVIVAAGLYGIQVDQMSGGLGLVPLSGTLHDWLASFGITVEPSLVMDPQNEPFPVPVMRNVGGMTVQEIQLIDYPFFVDVRQDGMDTDSPIVSNLPAITVHWTSPITVAEEVNAERDVHVLLQSSRRSWLKYDTIIQPNFDFYPDNGFGVGEDQQSYPLAVSVAGVFDSYFKDQPVPITQDTDTEEGEPQGVVTRIDTSAESARLVVVGSSEFLDDAVLGLSSDMSGERYRNNLQFVQNAVDWSVEDLDLLDIRARGMQVRVLEPMVEGEQSLWEGLNYGIALIALLGIGVVWNHRRTHEEPMFSFKETLTKSSRRSKD